MRKTVNSQLSLFRSERYDANFKYLFGIGNIKTEEEVKAFINKWMPQLHDMNYIGHDEQGNPCKSITRG